MTRSMTGFARSAAQGEWGEMSWELRSVNHRYLDVQPRLPEPLRALDSAVRQTVAKTVSRGKVEVTARFAPTVTAQGIDIDGDRLAALADALSTVRSTVIDCRAPDALDLLTYPGVLRDTDIDTKVFHRDALAALADALDALDATRKAEGERLADGLAERAQAIGEHAQAAATRLPQVRQAWADKLRARLTDLNIQADPARVEQEIVLTAQRMDVSEELERLHSHIAALRQALDKRGPIGRRLDFLMQEFNREANTLASKSQDAELSARAVEIKVLIEQMREQVQNIE